MIKVIDLYKHIDIPNSENENSFRYKITPYLLYRPA